METNQPTLDEDTDTFGYLEHRWFRSTFTRLHAFGKQKLWLYGLGLSRAVT